MNILQWLERIAPPESQLRIIPVSEETTQQVITTLAQLPHDTTLRIMLMCCPLALCPICWDQLRLINTDLPVFPGGVISTHYCSVHTALSVEVI